jgi:hypothetical protein
LLEPSIIRGEGNGYRVTLDDDEVAIRKESLKKSCAGEGDWCFLDEIGPGEVPVGLPLGKQSLCGTRVGKRMLLGHVGVGMSCKATRATVGTTTWQNRLQVLALILGNTGVVKAADLWMVTETTV